MRVYWTTLMYADDTTLVYIGPSVDVVCDALNRVLGDVHNWCRNNKLTIHSGKSEVMVLNRNSFCGPLKPVTLGDKFLSYVNSSFCLGVVIDSKLSWQPQITAVCKNFSRKVKNLKRLRVLPRRVLEAIYFRSIVPSVTYGVLVWGTCTLSLLCDFELIYLGAATLKRIHWQPLTNVYKLKLTSLMYSAYYGLIPKPEDNEKRGWIYRYQSTITPWEEHPYPTEGLLCGISCPSHINFLIAMKERPGATR